MVKEQGNCFVPKHNECQLIPVPENIRNPRRTSYRQADVENTCSLPDTKKGCCIVF